MKTHVQRYKWKHFYAKFLFDVTWRRFGTFIRNLKTRGGEQRCANGWETETTFSVTVFRFRTNFKMPKLKTDFLLIAHSENIIDAEELLLLSDVNASTNLDLPYWNYESVDRYRKIW